MWSTDSLLFKVLVARTAPAQMSFWSVFFWQKNSSCCMFRRVFSCVCVGSNVWRPALGTRHFSGQLGGGLKIVAFNSFTFASVLRVEIGSSCVAGCSGNGAHAFSMGCPIYLAFVYLFLVCTIDWCHDAGESHCNLVNMQLCALRYLLS